MDKPKKDRLFRTVTSVFLSILNSFLNNLIKDISQMWRSRTFLKCGFRRFVDGNQKGFVFDMILTVNGAVNISRRTVCFNFFQLISLETGDNLKNLKSLVLFEKWYY